ncbi:MAG: sugar ABC transporter permease [candidate division KSB1 bacterium]|nr:sugar ABC transporter permease [candidate division KSB1 bacterium]MDZ7335330.1 sugar ABC transporter permease [candidate division KSB1 bacterium]MDZ7356803.1 sugar ABC transporter permease [candidate division KSB1 bacterium]MDZ7377648.1 sugar ABC transporter permease [candidate division KSB1 bacterium]MDZ7399016.1 sugar ABC transporter permease [candidate division KSB1 bacterium]
MAAGVGTLKNNRLAYLYTMPALIVMGMVVVYPFIYNIVLSLSNMNLTHFYDWRIIGLTNYINVLKEGTFWYFFWKTILWTVINVFFHVTIGIFLALILNKDIKGKSYFRTLLILPWAVPQYITALTWRGMFNSEYGAISLIVDRLFGIQIPWLTTEWGAFAACVITNIWLGFPFMMIVALGGLQSIPDELYEAADIDGASWWNKLRNITIPLLKPVMIPAITLGIIWTFNNFNIVWLVSNGGEPADKTHILVSWIYKSGFRYFRMGYAAAFSMIIFVILLVFSFNFIRRTKAAEAVY